MTLRIARAADHRRMPWKNGGGETIELAIAPDRASLDSFDWRVSMATIAIDGPFSQFAGVDRTLAVLDGAGVELAIAGAAPIALTPDSEPLAFSGDAATTALLIDGPIVDLNVMTRRGRFAHALHRLEPAQPYAIAGGLTVVLARSDGIAITSGDHTAILDRNDAAIGERITIAPRDRSPAIVYVIELSTIS